MLPTIPLETFLVHVGRSEAIVGLNLPFEKVIPGKYRLVLEAVETATRQAVTLRADIQFRSRSVGTE